MKNNKIKGITLIALVVTIVVLLILAGITLTIVFGENGVINQAQKAKEAQNIAKYKDIFDTARFSVIAEKQGTITVDDFIAELKKEGIITDEGTQVKKNVDGSAVIKPEEGIDIVVKTIKDGKDIEIQYPDGTGNIGGGDIPTPPVGPETPKIAELVAATPDYTKTTNTYAEDAYGNKIVIPAGFAIVPNSGTKPADKTEEQWNAEKVVYSKAGEDGPVVQDGIVIQDSIENQFVWVPVGTIYNNKEKTSSNTITLGRYENFIATNGVYTPKQTVAQYKKTVDSTQTDLEYQEEYKIDSYFMELTKKQDGQNEIAEDLGSFLQNAEANGGYYIARYEASYDSGYIPEDYEAGIVIGSFENAKPLSRPSTTFREYSDRNVYTKGMLWNFINQANASKVARNMYQSEKVKSDLVNSYAWDTAIIFIQTYAEGKENYASQNSNNKSLANTGYNNDSVCNIHDMASNTYEWTTEYSSGREGGMLYPCSCVGGSYLTDKYFVSLRGADDCSRKDEYISFRPLLNCSPEI